MMLVQIVVVSKVRGRLNKKTRAIRKVRRSLDIAGNNKFGCRRRTEVRVSIERTYLYFQNKKSSLLNRPVLLRSVLLQSLVLMVCNAFSYLRMLRTNIPALLSSCWGHLFDAWTMFWDSELVYVLTTWPRSTSVTTKPSHILWLQRVSTSTKTLRTSSRTGIK